MTMADYLHIVIAVVAVLHQATVTLAFSATTLTPNSFQVLSPQQLLQHQDAPHEQEHSVFAATALHVPPVVVVESPSHEVAVESPSHVVEASSHVVEASSHVAVMERPINEVMAETPINEVVLETPISEVVVATSTIEAVVDTPSVEAVVVDTPSVEAVVLTPSTEAVLVKKQLLRSIDFFRTVQFLSSQGTSSDDSDDIFNDATRTTKLISSLRTLWLRVRGKNNKIDFYAQSSAVGMAADHVVNLCENLAARNPTILATENTTEISPVYGSWNLIFSTAARHSNLFALPASKPRSTSTAAVVVHNIVEESVQAKDNAIANLPEAEGSKEPLFQQIRSAVATKVLNDVRVAKLLHQVKDLFARFLFWSKRLAVRVPCPDAFLNRGRDLVKQCYARVNKVYKKALPKDYFNVIYLDDSIRIQRTANDNILVHCRPTYQPAKGLLVV